MRTLAFGVAFAAGLATSSAFAAELPVKAPAPKPSTPPWDIVVTTAIMNDYNFRGITQSNHRPSVQGGFEWRYNFNPNLQGYSGISGESIDFPNHAAAEVDLYGGIRPTLGKLALDFGAWYYWYPGGECFGAVAGPVGNCLLNGGGAPSGPAVPNPNFQPFGGNVAKKNASFYEIYAKATYTFNDQWAAGIQEWYSPSVSNTGAFGWFTTGNVTWTAPSTLLPNGLGMYISGDLGYWDLGTSDSFYGTGSPDAQGVVGSPFAFGVKYTSYATWDLGVGFTYKVLALDLRYYDTNLNQAQCNVFTSAQNSTFSAGNISLQNPNGLGTNWCGAAFIAKLSATVDFNTNLK